MIICVCFFLFTGLFILCKIRKKEIGSKGVEKNKKKERIFMVPTKRLLGIICDRKIYFFVELDRIKSTKYKYKYRKET